MAEPRRGRIRPLTTQRFTTEELPDTPTPDYWIPATGWVEAPRELLELGSDLEETAIYIRRIHSWLLWRAGPPVGRARYLAIAVDGSTLQFDLDGKRGTGIGADGAEHSRFRTWKESLRDTPG